MPGTLFVCVAAFLWGTVGVANSLMSERYAADPAFIGLVRTTLGALSLLVAASVLRLPIPSWRRLPVRGLVIFGLAGATFQFCLFAAFRQVGVTTTVAVTVCAPVVLAAAGEALWSRRAPDLGVALSIAIASAGVFLARPEAAAPGGGVASIDLPGMSLLAGASFAFSAVAATSRNLTHDLHPLWAAGLGLTATALVLSAVVSAEGNSAVLGLTRMTGGDLAILAYTGVAATGGGYLAFVLGMQLSRSAAAGLAATLIEPGVAALLAALLLRERLTQSEICGCSLMLFAMVTLFVADRRSRARSEARSRALGQ
ncbi:EamA family transporter [Amaricoccus macauensis]|uniref:EamA family transporter n=1 Tax=Amaricoccus macauensis TaxID=57001 RepID=UPI003C7A9CB3